MQFEMTQAQLSVILSACRPVPMIAIHTGMPPTLQERSNAAWASLGKEMGFDYTTVRPVSGKSNLFFTAEPNAEGPITPVWKGSLTRSQAIRLFERAADHDDPFWSDLVEDYYDEKTDTMPTIYHLFAALGITEDEYKEATDSLNVDWPDIPEEEPF